MAYSLQHQVSSVEMVEGDIIVMGSDGLFDNVFDHEIISTTSRYKDVVESGTGFYNHNNLLP